MIFNDVLNLQEMIVHWEERAGSSPSSRRFLVWKAEGVSWFCVSTNFQEAVQPTTLFCTLYSLYAKDRMPGLWKTGKMPSHKLRKTSRSENPCNHDLHPTHQSSSRMPERQRIAAVVDSFFSNFNLLMQRTRIYIYIFYNNIYIYITNRLYLCSRRFPSCFFACVHWSSYVQENIETRRSLAERLQQNKTAGTGLLDKSSI